MPEYDDIHQLEAANAVHEAALNAAAIVLQNAAEAEQFRRYQEHLENRQDNQ